MEVRDFIKIIQTRASQLIYVFYIIFYTLPPALAVTPGVFKYKTKVESVLVTDEDAVKSCLLFADQFRFLVEPACGAALSAVFNDQIFDKYLSSFNNVVVVVCGGSAVSLDIIESWKKSF